MKPATPIFIISCNRLKVLQATIQSFRDHIRTPFEIVIHDNRSTYAPLLAYLGELEREGTSVYFHRKRIVRPEQLDIVAETVAHWIGENGARHYVVTDPDVALVGECGDILEFYAHLLDQTPGIDVVGPMLRIDDIPDSYPLKAEVLERHTSQFWHKQPLEMEWKGRTVPYQHAPIDTTFGMYRGGFRFRRMCSGYRTYAPYWARHLDWYIDPKEMTPDQVYYLRHSSKVSHWGGAWLRRELYWPDWLKASAGWVQNTLRRVRG